MNLAEQIFENLELEAEEPIKYDGTVNLYWRFKDMSMASKYIVSAQAGCGSCTRNVAISSGGISAQYHANAAPAQGHSKENPQTFTKTIWVYLRKEGQEDLPKSKFFYKNAQDVTVVDKSAVDKVALTFRVKVYP